MALVLDTDVFSFIFKNDTRAAFYRSHINNQFLIVSFMTVAEVEQWALRSHWGTSAKAKIEKYLARHYIQQSTRDICRFWAKIKDEGRSSGVNISANDAFVAAVALYFEVPLVTHNAQDFKSIGGLTVISES